MPEEVELIVDEEEIRDSFASDQSGTVVKLSDELARLRIEVQRLSQAVEGLYGILREVAPDKLSRYELKQEMRRFLATREE